jgi:hypothetical protein
MAQECTETPFGKVISPGARLVKRRNMRGAELFEGRCQCGKLTYRVTGETAALFVCHCNECQRQSASAFGMALWLRNYDKRVSGELGSWTRTMPSGKELICELCPGCGTRLFHRAAGQSEILSIKPGTLDTPFGPAPVAQIWTSRARPWVRLPEVALSYPENPPSFDEMFAAWRALHGAAVGPA